MGRQRMIYSDIDLDNITKDMLQGIDRAVVAAAIKIRDDMRTSFKSSGSLYKHRTEKYDELADGIMIGKLQNSQVKIHAMGSKEKYNTYKTRFFVGGTTYRKQDTKQGKSIKPYSKGYIAANDAVDKGLVQAENTLNTYISHVLNN